MGGTTHLLRIEVSRGTWATDNSGPAGGTAEKLFCALVRVFSKERVVSQDPPRSFSPRGRGSHGAPGDASPRRGAGETVPSTARAPGLVSSSSGTVQAVEPEGRASRLSPVSASEAAGAVSPLRG